MSSGSSEARTGLAELQALRAEQARMKAEYDRMEVSCLRCNLPFSRGLESTVCLSTNFMTSGSRQIHSFLLASGPLNPACHRSEGIGSMPETHSRSSTVAQCLENHSSATGILPASARASILMKRRWVNKSLPMGGQHRVSPPAYKTETANCMSAICASVLELCIMLRAGWQVQGNLCGV